MFRPFRSFDHCAKTLRVDGSGFSVVWNIKVLLKQNLSAGSVLNTHPPSIRSGVYSLRSSCRLNPSSGDSLLSSVCVFKTETHSAGGVTEGETLYRSTVKTAATGTVWRNAVLFLLSLKKQLSTVVARTSVQLPLLLLSLIEDTMSWRLLQFELQEESKLQWKQEEGGKK